MLKPSVIRCDNFTFAAPSHAQASLQLSKVSNVNLPVTSFSHPFGPPQTSLPTLCRPKDPQQNESVSPRSITTEPKIQYASIAGNPSNQGALWSTSLFVSSAMRTKRETSSLSWSMSASKSSSAKVSRFVLPVWSNLFYVTYHYQKWKNLAAILFVASSNRSVLL